MSILSKTGLVPTPKKYFTEYIERKKKNFEIFVLSANVSKPVEFSVRPFGELYNPYSKGCSVLCNHPAPSAVRNVIRKAKDSWSSEGKIFYGSHKENFESAQFDTAGQIPEELFRRYTDTDSRPLTPSPTATSIRTKTSGGSFLNARRCVTPEPGKDTINKRKKIILDLRRSHSQETIYWKASSEVSQSVLLETSSSLIVNEEKVKELKESSEEQTKKKGVESISDERLEEKKEQQVCINDRDLDEDDLLHRRGKKRKKTKQTPANTTFHLSQDPETQIAALGPDSLNPSTRPSLIPNASTLLPSSQNKDENGLTFLKGSFLSEEAFKVLKTELDIDVVENTFERYLNRALREAIKYIIPKKKNIPEKYNANVTLKNLSFENNRSTMPRKLSKSASRFEMPLNLKFLEDMPIFEYLSEHVWISRQRKQIYRKTFLKYISKDDLDENGDPLPNSFDRRIPLVNFRKALYEVLGFYSSDEIITQVCDLINIDNYQEIHFRSWCGIVAFAERFALKEAQSTDSCEELEKSDFDSLDQRINILNLQPNMQKCFEIIRKGHVGRI